MDDQNLFIRNFWYDGTGPDAYFWVGNTRIPTPKGWVVPYPPVDLYSDLPKSGTYSKFIMSYDLMFWHFRAFWGVIEAFWEVLEAFWGRFRGDLGAF